MTKQLRSVDLDSVEMTFDILKYVINRISNSNPPLGAPKSVDELLATVGQTVTETGIGGENALQLFKDVLVKATIAEDHPRNLAFVPAAPSKASILFDLVTAASSLHGAYWLVGAGGIFCEMEAMKWLVSLTGLPEGSFGVFTSGGTAANLSAILAAREKWRNQSAQNQGLKGIIITSNGAHSSIKQMAKVMDVDVIIIEDDEHDCLSGRKLGAAIQALSPDIRQRIFSVVATSGTTNAGIIDDLESIAEVCQKENLWFHVDGAYGGAALAAPSVRHLFKGIEQADSITIDPHKWLFTPYDCGAVIYKDMNQAKQAHSQQGTYLEIFKEPGMEGFNPSEYQIQLTRRVRGLPLWFSLATHGTKTYEDAIEKGISLAKEAAKIIEERPDLDLVRQPSLSVVLFRKAGWELEEYKQWMLKNLSDGFALVTPTSWTKDGSAETVARFCFINPDTEIDDIIAILDSMD